MASSDPFEPNVDPRDTNSDPPDNNSDELSGSIRITFDKTTLLCDPCLEDGHNLPAEGYCVDCSHYLCADCYKHHLKPRVWRHHQLQDKQRMPKTKPAPVYKDECTDKCEEHGDEIIKLFCGECKQFGCTVCVAIEHNKDTCKVGYIPKLSKDFLQSKEYTSFKASLNSLANKAAAVLRDSSSNIEAVNLQADQALEEIRKLRKEIDSYFDKLEKEIVDKVEKTRAASQRKVEKISKQFEALSRDIGELQLDVTDKENKDQKCRLFVDTKKALEKLKEYDVRMLELGSETKVEDIQFIQSDLFPRLFQDKKLKLGVLVRQDKNIKLNTPGHSSRPSITGICVLPDNKVALADFRNNRINVINMESNASVTSRVNNRLWGITKVSDREVAVMQRENIVIYSVTNQEIKLKKKNQMSGVDDWTLLYTNSRFIVVTDTRHPTLRIVDMKGREVKTFPTEVHGNVLFNQPWYMAVNPDHTRIYVSDRDMETVTCLTFDGEVRARYKPKREWGPRGITVSRDGTVYVADSCNHTIHILSSDLQKICVINGRKYGIIVPCGLAYCDRDHKLYVSMWGNDEVVVLSV